MSLRHWRARITHYASCLTPSRRSWLLRVLLFLAVSALPNPPRPLVSLRVGPPQTVQTKHPIACVHTRLTDEVEPWKILRTLELVREMGAPTIVEYFPWAYYEPNRGEFDWSHADQVVDFARNQGLAVVARLGSFVPDWAHPTDDGSVPVDTYLPPERFTDFGDFVFAFVSHFTGRVRHIVIWNEPNVTAEWGFRRVDPEGYAELLRIAYTRAKEADPTMLVLGGALAPTIEPETSDLALNDLLYLERLYNAGAGRYFDVLAVHAYGLSFPPDEPPAPDALNFRRVELLREIMIVHGDADKPILITESGWNDSPRWTRAVTPGTRIDYTLAGYEWAEQHWPWAQTVCTWAFRYPAPQYSYGDYFTFVTPEFQLKPIYEAVREWAK